MAKNKTTLWKVCLKSGSEGMYLWCGKDDPQIYVPGTFLRIRTIQKSAAVRKFIKHNLPTFLEHFIDGEALMARTEAGTYRIEYG